MWSDGIEDLHSKFEEDTKDKCSMFILDYIISKINELDSEIDIEYRPQIRYFYLNKYYTLHKELVGGFSEK